jgi:hypothetical protein
VHLDHNQEALITRYLLGQLPPEQGDTIEERFFADSEYLEQILAAEDNLVDDYVADRLTARDRRDFEQHWLLGAERHRDVSVARLTRALISESPAGTNIANRPVTLNARGTKRFDRTRWIALAAAVALVACSGWLYIRLTQLRGELDTFRSARAALEADLTRLRRGVDRDRERLESVEAALRRERQEPDAQPRATISHENAPVSVVSFALVARPTRAGERYEPLLIPRTIRTVELQIAVPSEAERPAYAAFIRTPEGGEVWSASGIRARLGPERVVALTVPVAALRDGDYVVTVRAHAVDGATETVDSRAFSIRRR